MVESAKNPQQQKVLKTFGSNVRRQRLEVGMTQEKLAELAELNVRTVQKIEAGTVNILLTTIVRIQKALKSDWTKVMPTALTKK